MINAVTYIMVTFDLINIISDREERVDGGLSSQPSFWTDRDIRLWDSADFAPLKKSRCDSKENASDYTTTPSSNRGVFKQKTVHHLQGATEPPSASDTRNQQLVSREDYLQQLGVINSRLDHIESVTLSCLHKIVKLRELHVKLLARQKN